MQNRKKFGIISMILSIVSYLPHGLMLILTIIRRAAYWLILTGDEGPYWYLYTIAGFRPMFIVALLIAAAGLAFAIVSLVRSERKPFQIIGLSLSAVSIVSYIIAIIATFY